MLTLSLHLLVALGVGALVLLILAFVWGRRRGVAATRPSSALMVLSVKPRT